MDIQSKLHLFQALSSTRTNTDHRGVVVSATESGSEVCGFESHQSHVGFFSSGRVLPGCDGYDWHSLLTLSVSEINAGWLVCFVTFVLRRLWSKQHAAFRWRKKFPVAEKQEAEVGFNARFSSKPTVSVTGTQNIVFDHVDLNQGHGYDKITGMFTAPVSGLYQFSLHIPFLLHWGSYQSWSGVAIFRAI